MDEEVFNAKILEFLGVKTITYIIDYLLNENPDGAGVEELAKNTGICRNTVVKTLKELSKKRVVVRVDPERSRDTRFKVYAVNFENEIIKSLKSNAWNLE